MLEGSPSQDGMQTGRSSERRPPNTPPTEFRPERRVRSKSRASLPSTSAPNFSPLCYYSFKRANLRQTSYRRVFYQSSGRIAAPRFLASHTAMVRILGLYALQSPLFRPLLQMPQRHTHFGGGPGRFLSAGTRTPVCSPLQLSSAASIPIMLLGYPTIHFPLLIPRFCEYQAPNGRIGIHVHTNSSCSAFTAPTGAT